MEYSPIKTEEEYKAALKETEQLFELDENSLGAERVEIHPTLIEAYEEKHYCIPKPNLLNRILYFLESRWVFRR